MTSTDCDPLATEEEIRAAFLQFVRKLSRFNKPSRANQAAFDVAGGSVSQSASEILASLTASVEPRSARPARVRVRP
ncbi:MAG: DUF2277 domain-containing protein [Deltaproteobacteria bacterium]|nr:DUF2277 domain-containing protein [Deltaproteobacteria bacterium]MBW2223107.1 DUF2277 domain-containing protein [Deltaproteobacteria bacterium]MBW2403354.1 DUF2277 domain-containing protein [Deltaproteobacteria bacterium]MBW2547282.1 DUF2277 domain-containing protein [Deltaproteobacteria bacterium]MBW2719959.1 DUF2277 domain-containing protein [Deltaproteobacteria bacterium]